MRSATGSSKIQQTTRTQAKALNRTGRGLGTAAVAIRFHVSVFPASAPGPTNVSFTEMIGYFGSKFIVRTVRVHTVPSCSVNVPVEVVEFANAANSVLVGFPSGTSASDNPALSADQLWVNSVSSTIESCMKRPGVSGEYRLAFQSIARGAA